MSKKKTRHLRKIESRTVPDRLVLSEVDGNDESQTQDDETATPPPDSQSQSQSTSQTEETAQENGEDFLESVDLSDSQVAELRSQADSHLGAEKVSNDPHAPTRSQASTQEDDLEDITMVDCESIGSQITTAKSCHIPIASPVAVPDVPLLQIGKSTMDHVYVLLDWKSCCFDRSLLALGERGGELVAAAIEQAVIENLDGNGDYRLSTYLFLDKLELMTGMLAELCDDPSEISGLTPAGDTRISWALLDEFLQGFQRPLLNMVVEVNRTFVNSDYKMKAFYSMYLRAPETRSIFLQVSPQTRECLDKDEMQSHIYQSRVRFIPDLGAILGGIAELESPEIAIKLEEVAPSALLPSSRMSSPASPYSPRSSQPPPNYHKRSGSAGSEYCRPIVGSVWMETRKPTNQKKSEDADPIDSRCPEYYLAFPGISGSTIFQKSGQCPQSYDHNHRNKHHKPGADLVSINQFRQRTQEYTPCPNVLSNNPCSAWSGMCIYAHVCPHGPLCERYRTGTCLFNEGMHARGPYKVYARRVNSDWESCLAEGGGSQETREMLRSMIEGFEAKITNYSRKPPPGRKRSSDSQS